MKSAFFKMVIGLVFLALFNILYFIVGGIEHTSLDWVCYGFIHVSYLMILITPLFCLANKKMSVQSSTLYLIVFFYFIIELVVGLLFMYFKPQTNTWAIIVQSVLLAIFLVLQLASVLANDATNKSLKKQEVESINIESLVLRLRESMRMVSDVEARRLVKLCVDAVSSSPRESFSEVAEAETAMQVAVDDLCFAIDSSASVEEISKKAKDLKVVISRRNSAISMHRLYNK